MRKAVGTPGLEPLGFSPSLVPESRWHMFTFCGMAFLLDVALPFCSWFELDKLKGLIGPLLVWS